MNSRKNLLVLVNARTDRPQENGKFHTFDLEKDLQDERLTIMPLPPQKFPHRLHYQYASDLAYLMQDPEKVDRVKLYNIQQCWNRRTRDQDESKHWNYTQFYKEINEIQNDLDQNNPGQNNPDQRYPSGQEKIGAEEYSYYKRLSQRSAWASGE